MKRSLKAKFILSFLAVALITVTVVSVLIRLTSGQSLMNLVVEQQTADLKIAAQGYYSAYSTMDGFFEYYLINDAVFNRPMMGDMHDMRGLNGMVDGDLKALIPFAGYNIGEDVPRDLLKQAVEVEVDGKTVAWILPDNKYQFALNAEEQLFLRRTNLAIGLAALAGVVAAVIMGYLLAGRLIRPIRLLSTASKRLAAGDLQQQVPVTSHDELGQLTETFNMMSAELFEADQKRKRLTADITHDLSTPLQIISGYIEMLESGDVSLTPERIEVIKAEIEHLRRLVGDMTTLTQAESGALELLLQPTDPSSILEHVARIYQPIVEQKGINLKLDIKQGLPFIKVDEGRLIQVLKNLVDNALRYTSAGGTIRLSAATGEVVSLIVQDSGEGIDHQDLPYVFDRFYRADKNRSGASGKMGLGLAICKALVYAQGGSIAVDSAGKGQGTTFVINFPPV